MHSESSESSDTQLMARIAAGDTQAFRALVERHLPKAHAVARRVLASVPDAEEAAQEAFCKIWVHAASFQSERAAFSTWLYRIVTNVCLDMARRRPQQSVAIEDMQDMLADGAPGTEAQAAAAQEGLHIRQAVLALPERQRVAVVLCYFEDMTNPEAAAVMYLNIKALEGLLVRARKNLRGQLGDRG